MPRSRDSLCVLAELKNLSSEADHVADSLPKVSDLEPFFTAIKEKVLKIKECTTVKQLKEIKFPLEIQYYLNKEEKVKIIHTPETQKEHVHGEKIVSPVYKTAEKNVENGRKENIVISICKTAEKNVDNGRKENIVTSVCKTAEKNVENVEKEKIVTSVCKSTKKERLLETCLPASEEKSNSVASLSKSNEQTPKFPKTSYNVKTPKLFKTPCADQQTIEITAPVLNRTITKESNQTPLNKILIHAAEETVRITRSGSRNKVQGSNSKIASLQEISSAVKLRMQDENKISSSQVLSGSKRKSNSSSKKKNKKPKVEVKNKSQTSQSKPTLKSNVLRQANGPTLNPKVCPNTQSQSVPIIVPTLKHSLTSDVNVKEKKLEEIQKKEEKANKNLKKVLANRQLKADEQKKKREEKMEKALQKRLLLDKEKDHDRSMDTKMSQAKVLVESVKNSVLKPKSKELQEQQAPETGTSISQKEMTVQATNKTPAKDSSHDSETYDLTPAPDSSTYDFSDEEENDPKGKPIPSWAQGVLLKSALIHQFYNPPDANAIFGTYIEVPDLAELFGVKKNYYYKRTSSAVWNTTPN